jgi:hypothetical protein
MQGVITLMMDTLQRVDAYVSECEKQGMAEDMARSVVCADLLTEFLSGIQQQLTT